jgi:hypothetical protein
MEPENPFDLPWLEGDGMHSEAEEEEEEEDDDDDLSVEGDDDGEVEAEAEAGVEENGPHPEGHEEMQQPAQQLNAAQPAAPNPPGAAVDPGPFLQNQPHPKLPKSTLARPVALVASSILYS